ncbi:MAG: hypothetical protein HRS50_01475 [Mycoplasmataceae bacterium]|nr:hypothetical protein [Mycoplasmataceae bacterium]
MATKDVIIKALSNVEPILVKEIISTSTFKYLGFKNIDLYIFTNKKFTNKIIKNNISNIKIAIKEIENKIVRNVYVNNKLIQLNLKELNSKNDINTIDLTSLNSERTHEISGENDIVKEIFTYESSILNKNKITVSLYNKELNKEFVKKINTNIINNKMLIMKKRKIYREFKKFLNLKYLPTNNVSKEFIEFLHLL